MTRCVLHDLPHPCAACKPNAVQPYEPQRPRYINGGVLQCATHKAPEPCVKCAASGYASERQAAEFERALTEPLRNAAAIVDDITGCRACEAEDIPNLVTRLRDRTAPSMHGDNALKDEAADALEQAAQPVNVTTIPLSDALAEPCKGCGRRPADFLTGARALEQATSVFSRMRFTPAELLHVARNTLLPTERAQRLAVVALVHALEKDAALVEQVRRFT